MTTIEEQTDASSSNSPANCNLILQDALRLNKPLTWLGPDPRERKQAKDPNQLQYVCPPIVCRNTQTLRLQQNRTILPQRHPRPRSGFRCLSRQWQTRRTSRLHSCVSPCSRPQVQQLRDNWRHAPPRRLLRPKSIYIRRICFRYRPRIQRVQLHSTVSVHDLRRPQGRLLPSSRP